MNQIVKKTGTVELGKSFRPSLADNWCETVNEVTKTDLKWNVHLPNLDSRLTEMKTTPFTCKNYFTWNLSLSDYSTMINIGVNLTKGTMYPNIIHPIRVVTGIANKKGDLLFPNTLLIENGNQSFVMSQIKKSDIDDSIFHKMGGDIIIYCALEFRTLKETKHGSKSKTTSDVSHKELLLTQLEELRENKTLSDVNLNVGDRIFAVHKNILAARSKVFAAMFEHETAEKLSNKVDIQDVDPDVFQEVLRYMYTGRVSAETMEKMAVEIMAVADKYMLDQLKDECEIYLKNGMSADNCFELLALSGQPHPAMHLKKYAVDFLRRYPALVRETDGWKKAKKEKLFWSCDLIEMMCGLQPPHV